MRFVIPVLLTISLAAPAAAGDRHKQVWVTQADSGEVLHGRILALSRETLALLSTDNRQVDVPLDRVLRIEVHGDSLKNGTTIGAAIMGGLSLIACGAASTRVSQCATALVFNTGFGALLGAGIDAVNGGRTVIYSKPAPSEPPGAGASVRLKVLKLRF